MTYKLMPNCVTDWKEALFMGYFGPIGIGAVFYVRPFDDCLRFANTRQVEHTRHLFPEPGEALTEEENNLTRAMIPTVYWLVVFSIFWHGLSIPALNLFYKWRGVPSVEDQDGPAVVRHLSVNNPAPKNSTVDEKRGSVVLNNRFSRNYNTADLDMNAVEQYRRRTQAWMQSGDTENLSSQEKLNAVTFSNSSPHYEPGIKARLGKTQLDSRQYI
jgi:hypothetical protein